MKKRGLVKALIILALAFFAFATWYKLYFSMEVVSTYEVNQQIQQRSILIATQGSEYKDAIVKDLVEHYRSQPIYVKVTDVTNLGEVDESVWDAILILHTWEMWKPQPDAEAFLNKVEDQSKVVVLTTSGEGDAKMETVDAVTGASVMEAVPSKVDEVKARIDMILNLPATNNSPTT